eukprot:scaffold98644_cov28-Tisochrysis_lutea.AAC.3
MPSTLSLAGSSRSRDRSAGVPLRYAAFRLSSAFVSRVRSTAPRPVRKSAISSARTRVLAFALRAASSMSSSCGCSHSHAIQRAHNSAV